ncbi:hypothetical protein DPMN_033235 [Dreissena polymorpha]|uniref:Uncharacterized protein n=1 Tax=Dreissena polymorpha TaxID=45954 RepID=A0A9D4M830_DREPO|nr:hypothetical protein DPMN_033235 [Dreissena polymorpha]
MWERIGTTRHDELAMTIPQCSKWKQLLQEVVEYGLIIADADENPVIIKMATSMPRYQVRKQEHRLAGADRSSIFFLKVKGLSFSITKEGGVE